jgi:cbb3-type cytochrome oxidase subunit 3
MKNKHFAAFSFVFLAAFLFLFSLPALAAKGNFGLDATIDTKTDGFSPKDALLDPTTNTPQVLAGKIIGTVLAFVGVIFFVLIFYSGLKWMMAQGNESEIDKAKQTIIAATIGLIIVLAAYSITAFIGGQLTKTN